MENLTINEKRTDYINFVCTGKDFTSISAARGHIINDTGLQIFSISASSTDAGVILSLDRDWMSIIKRLNVILSDSAGWVFLKRKDRPSDTLLSFNTHDLNYSLCLIDPSGTSTWNWITL